MSKAKSKAKPRQPAYAGNRLLRDWTRIYDECMREERENRGTTTERASGATNALALDKGVTTPPFKNGGFLGLRLVQPPALTPQRSVQPHSAHDAGYSKRRFRPCLGLVRTQDTDAHAH